MRKIRIPVSGRGRITLRTSHSKADKEKKFVGDTKIETERRGGPDRKGPKKGRKNQ